MTPILPRPRTYIADDGAFTLDASTTISAPDELTDTMLWLQHALRATRLPLARAQNGAGSIRLGISASLGPESYRLTVNESGVVISGGDAAGVFYGAQVLRQLLPDAVYRTAAIEPVSSWSIPFVRISDAPRFRWRGAMIDVVRHFMPKHDLLRFIDLLALHRLNTLHLHLTDDQGWRVEIRSHPRLTEVGSWRHRTQVGPPPASPLDNRPHGGFYTQDDIREIVAYAQDRHIDIVPEIDIPGHSQAAIAAYPELGVGVDEHGRGGPNISVGERWGIITDVLNTEDTTVDFYRDVFTEIMDLFPGRYIGVGGDECPTDQWAADARTQELMRQRGLADEKALQDWFNREIANHIVARGRRPFGWDELLEGTPVDETVVASWRGMTGARTAIRQGFDVVACPDDKVYLNYRASEREDEPIPFAVPITVQDAYAFEPVPGDATPEQRSRVLGGQANIWTEHIDSPRIVDYFTFPRLCAIAEVLWSDSHDDFDAFSQRLEAHLGRLDAIGVEYRRSEGPLPWQTRPDVVGLPLSRDDHAAQIAGLVADIAD